VGVNMPSKSIYEVALQDKKIAAAILLPLIEFEFAFFGSQKPSITQARKNIKQLRVLYKICKQHGWTATKISKLGNKDEFWFKISNNGFKEIYKLAGPMADELKDKWAQLLCKRAESTEKERNIREKIIKILSERKDGIRTWELCLKLERLPYTITRHLRLLQKEGLVKKIENKWISASTPANSPS